MSRIMVVAVLACSILQAGRATAQNATDRAAVEKQVVANEKAIIDAIMKNDPKTFHSYVVPESFAMGGDGVIKVGDMDKMMSQMKVDCKFTKWGLADSTFYWLNDMTLVHMYKSNVDGSCRGNPESAAWASSVWVRKDGKWLATFHHESFVAPPTPAAKK